MSRPAQALPSTVSAWRPDPRQGAPELCGLLTLAPGGQVLATNAVLHEWVGTVGVQVVGNCITRLLTQSARLTWETQVAAKLSLRGRVDAVELTLSGADGADVPVLLTAQASAGDGTVHAVLFHAGGRARYERELLHARRAAERSAATLRLLHRVAADLAQARTASEVAQTLAGVLASACAATSVAVWLHDPERGGLRRTAGTRPADELGPADVPLTATALVAAAVRRREVVTVESLRDCAQAHPAVVPALSSARMQAAVAVPVLVDGSVLGAYQLTFARSRLFDDDELELQRTVAEQVGQALQRAQLQENLSHLALHDPMTGLPNRSLFFDRLEQALAAATRTDRPVCVMMIDLDGFKLVNDGLGHRAGDLVLLEVARRLREQLRSADTVARLGGDEFAVLCADSDQDAAEALAVRLEQAVGRPVDVGGDEAMVTASVGLVVHRPPFHGRSDALEVLRAADTAMYAAKRSGKARHTVYDAALRAEVDDRGRTEVLLREAIEQDLLVVHYQPVYDLRTGRATGVEALCRLQRPDGALIGPSEFIAVAEERGLIVALGRSVLRTACAQLAHWHADGLTGLEVAVNVAAEQAAQDGFTDGVAGILADTGCPPEALVLELTESTLLTATPGTLAALHAVRALGVGIALDDFGTRYASLRYVQQFPITELKIDRSFVAGLPGGRTERAIVTAVAGLAASLELVCVAEGIETVEQAEVLRGLGVRGQGYHLGRPSDAKQCTSMLRRQLR